MHKSENGSNSNGLRSELGILDVHHSPIAQEADREVRGRPPQLGQEIPRSPNNQGSLQSPGWEKRWSLIIPFSNVYFFHLILEEHPETIYFTFVLYILKVNSASCLSFEYIIPCTLS
jgi:hypothetical protein